MYSIYFILYACLLQILFLLKTSECLRANEPKAQTLDKSGWRNIDTSTLEGREFQTSDEEKDKETVRNENHSTTSTSTTTTIAPTKSKKLVEWDDDELNDLRDSKDSRPFFISLQDSKKVPKQDLLALNKIKASNYYRQQQQQQQRFKLGAAKFSRLVYHGQVRANNTIRVIDGMKLYINTHKPLKINRNVMSNQKPDTSAIISNTHLSSLISSSGEVEPKEEPSSVSSHWAIETTPTRKLKYEATDSATKRELNKSDWKPILANSSAHRVSLANEKKLFVGDKVEKLTKFDGESKAAKWKPIVEGSKPIVVVESGDSMNANKKLDAGEVSKGAELGVIYGKKQKEFKSQHHSSSVEEPFDDDGIITSQRGIDFEKVGESGKQQLGQREPKSIAEEMTATNKSLDNRWTPVETTTLDGRLVNFESIITTITPPSSAVATANGTQMESAQKSASDTNYIYSSQPVSTQAQDWLTSGRPSTNGYYSNYVMQPQQPALEHQPQPMPVAPSAPIIDTTSGQTPEMIADREPDPVPVSSGDYSVPQTSVGAFQPAQSPPNRPSSGGYGSYGSYDSHSYYAPAPVMPTRAQPIQQQQPLRQPQQVSPVVRQEHHYHYYNSQHQQQQPLGDRQLSQQPQQQIQTQNIIRELQPLFISQPAIQQQATSTTPAPAPAPAPTQIIREIIKEVPVQTMALQLPQPPPPPPPIQLPRIILPPPIPIPVPTREVESSGLAGYAAAYSPTAPAQRIIRQISNSIPTVRLQVPQIRLPIPALQLPTRMASNPAPITRQTGSFVIPPVPQKTTTFLTETQAMPTHTTIMQTTQFTPATRTTVYTTEHQASPAGVYKAKK